MAGLEFMDRGLCADDPEPDAWTPHAGEDATYAKRICGRCPAQIECRAYALDRPKLKGIWGGLRDSERDELRGDTPDRNVYTPETRTAALAMFAEMRPNYRSDAATHRAVAKELGIADPETVRRWREKYGQRHGVAQAA